MILPFTRWTWTRLLLACHPRNLRGISAENTSVLFTFGTWFISCYFRSAKVRLPLLYRQISKYLQVNIQEKHFYIRSIMMISWTGESETGEFEIGEHVIDTQRSFELILNYVGEMLFRIENQLYYGLKFSEAVSSIKRKAFRRSKESYKSKNGRITARHDFWSYCEP